jgi:2-dehydro-3-deoxyphosphogalactonate aldolase
MNAPIVITTEMVAILRGLTTGRALETGKALVAAGFRTIEVPLNSPTPLDTIKLLAAAHPDCLLGAGTVLTAQDVNNVRAAGGRLIVSPNCDPQVIRHAVGFGMRVMPGIATPTEAFAAVNAGATELKLFPASTY